MLRFLTNTDDPKNKEARWRVRPFGDETQEQAWRNYLKWLEDKVIGDPQATEAYTVEQLKAMGLVGVYVETDTPPTGTP